MDYKFNYDTLINSRKLLVRNKKSGIFENHHIIPRSLGGTNEKENLVLLTPKEHFIAHLLLTKIYSGINKSKMCFALWRLCNKDKKLNSRRYEYSKKIFIDNCVWSGGRPININTKNADVEFIKNEYNNGSTLEFIAKETNLTRKVIHKILKINNITIRKRGSFERTEETINKLKNKFAGEKNPFYKKTHSTEAKKKISYSKSLIK